MGNSVGFIDEVLKDPIIKELTEKYKSIGFLNIEKKPVSLETFLFDKEYIGLETVSPKQAKFLLASDNDCIEDFFEVTLDNDNIIKIKPGTTVKLKNGSLQLIEMLKVGDEVDI